MTPLDRSSLQTEADQQSWQDILTANDARALSHLNEHLLRDIGLSRVTVDLTSGDLFRKLR
ncbi:MAG: DUF1127 domain-containing protein [Pseudomonadota bacterium]